MSGRGVADAADEAEFEVLVEEEKSQKRDQVIQDLMNELKYREQLYVLTSMHYQFKNMLFVLPILVAGTGKQRVRHLLRQLASWHFAVADDACQCISCGVWCLP
jgi:hypothetical protein